jgi:DNA-binding PadR family transcriptional regulator
MPLEHAILAFLEFRPMSGYDLKKFFDVSVAHFWSTTRSHIYKALEGLEEKEWARVRVIPQDGKPSRKEYHITDEGHAELRRWLVSPMPMEPVREPFLVQVFFSHSSTNEEIAALFETRMREIREQLQVLRGAAQMAINKNAKHIGVERARLLWQITLDYGIAYYEFDLAWHEKMLEKVWKLPALGPPNP